MKITKTLLERYELGLCTEAEHAAVNDWLDSADLEMEELDGSQSKPTTASAPEDEAIIKEELWQNIAAHMKDSDSKTDKQHTSSSNHLIASTPVLGQRQLGKWLSVAAATIAVLSFAWWIHASDQEPSFFNASNSGREVIIWEEDSFEFSLSKNSSASINFQSGNMAVSGQVLFIPKRDLILYDQHNNNSSLDFRQGEVYYISTDPDTSKLVVYSKTEIEYLPPILQKHIRKQFHLT